MMLRIILSCFLSWVLLYSHTLKANVISVDEILKLAEQNSYAISASQYQALAAKKGIIIAKAGYFPIVNFEAIDTKGFPGSNNWLDVDGLMGSPFRKNLSAGVVAKQIIYDFGRTKYDVKRSQYQADLAEKNTQITAYEAKILALLLYYDCAQFRTLEKIWADLSKEAEIITKEVNRFVNTGQRSIVDKYLSQVQLEQTRTAVAYYNEQIKGVKHELAFVTSLNENAFTCEMLTEKSKGLADPTLYSSPFLARAKADLNVAKASLCREKANFLPQIVGIASLGAMDKTHLVQKKGYSIGLGFIMPIYDLHVIGGVKRAQEIVMAKNQEVKSQIQTLEEMNAQYDTTINSSSVRLDRLKKELLIAQEGFTVAKRRYFDLEGQLVDLREAFADLMRISVDTEDTRTTLLKAQGSKELLNGG